VIGIDVDRDMILVAIKFAQKNSLEIEFIVQDVKDVEIKCDTILMNPPFGSQKSNQKADRKFIEKGFEISQMIYSLHLKKTIPFIEKMISSLDGDIVYQKDYVFPIKWMFSFHDKEIVNYDVTLLKIDTDGTVKQF